MSKRQLVYEESGMRVNLDPLGEIARQVPVTVSDILSVFSLPVIYELIFFKDPLLVLAQMGKVRYVLSVKERHFLQLMPKLGDSVWHGLRYEWRLRKKPLRSWTLLESLEFIRTGELPSGIRDRVASQHLRESVIQKWSKQPQVIASANLSREHRSIVQEFVLAPRRPVEIKATTELNEMLLDGIEDAGQIADLEEEDETIVEPQGQNDKVQELEQLCVAMRQVVSSSVRSLEESQKEIEILKKESASIKSTCEQLSHFRPGAMLTDQSRSNWEDILSVAMDWLVEDKEIVRMNIRAWLKTLPVDQDPEVVISNKLREIYRMKRDVMSVPSDKMLSHSWETDGHPHVVSAMANLYPRKSAYVQMAQFPPLDQSGVGLAHAVFQGGSTTQVPGVRVPIEVPVVVLEKEVPRHAQVTIPVEVSDDGSLDERVQEVQGTPVQVVKRGGRIPSELYYSGGFIDRVQQYRLISWLLVKETMDRTSKWYPKDEGVFVNVSYVQKEDLFLKLKSRVLEVVLSMEYVDYPFDITLLLTPLIMRIHLSFISNPVIRKKGGIPKVITEKAVQRNEERVRRYQGPICSHKVCLFQLEGGQYVSLPCGQAKMGIALYLAIKCGQESRVRFRMTHSVPSLDWFMGHSAEMLPFVEIIGPNAVPIRSIYLPLQFNGDKWRVYRMPVLSSSWFSGMVDTPFWITIFEEGKLTAVPFRVVSRRRVDEWQGVSGRPAYSDLGEVKQGSRLFSFLGKQMTYSDLKW